MAPMDTRAQVTLSLIYLTLWREGIPGFTSAGLSRILNREGKEIGLDLGWGLGEPVY